jgi:RNA-directed DNA polymerase
MKMLRLFTKVDLLKFYDTITEKRVYGIFKSMGYIESLTYVCKIATAKLSKVTG